MGRVSKTQHEKGYPPRLSHSEEGESDNLLFGCGIDGYRRYGVQATNTRDTADCLVSVKYIARKDEDRKTHSCP